jgi:hypothetical protein
VARCGRNNKENEWRLSLFSAAADVFLILLGGNTSHFSIAPASANCKPLSAFPSDGF